MKMILFKIVASIENAFDPKNGKIRFALNVIMLLLIISFITFIFVKNDQNKDTVKTNLDNYRVANFSSIKKKQLQDKNDYASEANNASKDGNSEKAFSAGRKELLIENAQNAQANYVLEQPGKVSMNYLDTLTNDDIDWNRKVYNIQNCDFTPGQTMWLYKEWISKTIDVDPSDTKEGFVYQSRDLYLNYPNIDQEKANYLNDCIQLIWKSSDLYPIVNDKPLKIHYLNQPQYNQNCNE